MYKMIELWTACLRFALKKALLCYLKLLNTIRVIFNENIIDRKNKIAYAKLTKKNLPPFWHSSPLPVTSSSGKDHKECMYAVTSIA